MGSCRDLEGSLVRTVVVGVRLVEASALNADQIAKKVLEDAKVREALDKAFRNVGAQLTGAALTGVPLDGAAAKSLASGLASPAGKAALDAIQKQPEYKELERGLADLKCAFANTPTGIFIDNNKTWLIIVGAVLAVGGAAFMYVTKQGDLPAQGMAMIGNKLGEGIKVGQITFGVKDLEFKPSEQEVKGGIEISVGNLKTVQVEQKLEISGAVKGGNLESMKVMDTLVVRLTPSVDLSAKAGFGLTMAPQAPPLLTYDMALSIKHTASGGLSLEISAFGRGVGTQQNFGMTGTLGKQWDSSGLFGKGSTTSLNAWGGIQTNPFLANPGGGPAGGPRDYFAPLPGGSSAPGAPQPGATGGLFLRGTF